MDVQPITRAEAIRAAAAEYVAIKLEMLAAKAQREALECAA